MWSCQRRQSKNVFVFKQFEISQYNHVDLQNLVAMYTNEEDYSLYLINPMSCPLL